MFFWSENDPFFALDYIDHITYPFNGEIAPGNTKKIDAAARKI